MTMDCYRWNRVEQWLASCPKANDYQKLKDGTYNQEEEESEIDLHTTDYSEGSESEDED